MNTANFYPILKKMGILLVFFPFFNLMAQDVKPFDILINEFMPDPSPPVGLPNTEYIELYNRSSNSINLKEFKLFNGSVSTELPDSILKPKHFIIIHGEKKDTIFSKLGNTIRVEKLITLSNSGDIFYLVSPNKTIIDAVYYDLSFYQDLKKASGGWALERVDTADYCFIQNWAASIDSSGGTPGERNSILKQDSVQKRKRVQSPLEVTSIFVKNSKEINVSFNKKMNKYAALDYSSYEVINLANNTKVLITNKLKFLDSLENRVSIPLSTTLKDSTRYKFVIKNTVNDCKNNPLSKTDDFEIQLPEKPMRDSLIINEVLFDPKTGGSRFIELYNRSKTKVFDVGDLTIGNSNKSVTVNYLLFPNKYVVLTPDPHYIKTHYKVDSQYHKAIIKNNLPTWANDKGEVILRQGSTIIDSFFYTKTFHNPLLTRAEGVSLERIFQDKPSISASNWQSAAESKGFATPAYQNSQHRLPSLDGLENTSLRIETPVFSPDGDGFQDVFLMQYKMAKEGFVATWIIYDYNGRLVKKLKINELLALEGQVKWEGDTDEGLPALSGTYIFYAELKHPTGESKRWKKAFVLTYRN
jgi:hypothetical protein